MLLMILLLSLLGNFQILLRCLFRLFLKPVQQNDAVALQCASKDAVDVSGVFDAKLSEVFRAA